MPNFEDIVKRVLAEKVISEDVSGQNPPTAVVPSFQDLGPAVVNGTDGQTDYSGPIQPGQASLPSMNPTPGVGTVGNSFTPNAVREDEEKDEDKEIAEDAEPTGETVTEEETVSEDRTPEDENAQQKEKLASAEKQEKIQEDIEALFVGEKLSKAFKRKAATLYEAAVAARINEALDAEVGKLQEAFQNKFDAEVDAFKIEMNEKVEAYLNYLGEEWVNANSVALERSIKTDLVENLILDLKGCFQRHNIDIPDEKVNVLESLAEKVESLETSLNEQIEKNAALLDSNRKLVKQNIVNEAASGLNEAEKGKFIKLSESVEFKNEDSFKESLKTIRESAIIVKPKTSASTQSLTEEVNPVSVPTVTTDNDVELAKQALKRLML
jgi:hypothetical protein